MRKRGLFERLGRHAGVAVGVALMSPGVVTSTELSEKLQIFGHLTQAYGETDRGSIGGATEGGTTDLRKVAVQFRWEISERDTAVVQLSHERRGNDVLFPEQDALEIDWAFYEIRPLPATSFKVGRLNVPLGIYNEVRDVGTLLPFFNLPISFYAGVVNSAETVDGVSVAHTFAARTPWSLDAELYYGGWDTFQQQVDPDAEFDVVSLEARAEDGIGVQLWLHTPIEGFRVGAGALTWLLDSPLSRGGPSKDRFDTFHASLDATLERWTFRAEYRKFKFDQDFGAFLGLPVSLPGKAEREGYYAQLGWWPTPKIGLFGQYEETSLGDNLNLLPELDDLHAERAVSVNYRMRTDLLVRVEFHSADTRLPLGDASQAPGTVQQGKMEVEWVIVAFSVSF